MMGIGGTPEGVIAAAVARCLGGTLQGVLWPRTVEERGKLVDAGYDLERVLDTKDLVGGESVFVAATGITNGAMLRGVRFKDGGASTDSIVMRTGSGTVRRTQAEHMPDKLKEFAPPIAF